MDTKFHSQNSFHLIYINRFYYPILGIKSEPLHYGNGGSGTLASIASLCNANNHNGIINNKKGMMGIDDNGVDGRNQQFAMAQSGVMNSGGLQQQRGQVVMNGWAKCILNETGRQTIAIFESNRFQDNIFYTLRFNGNCYKNYKYKMVLKVKIIRDL